MMRHAYRLDPPLLVRQNLHNFVNFLARTLYVFILISYIFY